MKPTTIEVVGVYPVRLHGSVYLIECVVRDSRCKFEVGLFTQQNVNEPKENWQVPYDEKILNVEGTEIEADPWFDKGKEIWKGDVRFVFFFHDLDTTKPLRTPFGEVMLPPESRKPRRLAFMKYETP